MTIVLVPLEVQPGETRVAAVPDTIRRMVKAGLTVRVETGAGVAAQIDDAEFESAGAELVDRDESWAEADLVLKVQPPTMDEVAKLKRGATLVSFAWPAGNEDVVRALMEAGVATLAMDLVPRISRAQSMDALSSQATVAGYKAVLLAASHMPVMCPLLMTAAGTIPPAKMVVFGAGVAGLQAIAMGRRLGCVVEATDVRLAAKEQVESLGARFIEVPGAEDLEDEGGYAKEASEEFLARQREEVSKRVAEADCVITTALIPGRPAPRLISEDLVRAMRRGAVIVDLAAEAGGNCELTECGQVVERHGVTIVGQPNLPASVPRHASELYSKNILSLIKLGLAKGEESGFAINLKDEVHTGCLLTWEGKVMHPRTAEGMGLPVGTVETGEPVSADSNSSSSSEGDVS